MRAIPTVLIVDDEPDILDLAEITLVKLGLNCLRAASLQAARAALMQGPVDLCLTDMRLPDGNGLELVAEIVSQYPRTPVAMLTAFGSAESAVAALKAGAFDYLAKPVSVEQLRALVKTALRVPGRVTPAGVPAWVGTSETMIQLRQTLDKLAHNQAPVFIHGESGTGKEIAARLIHALGPRAEKPFVAVNCGAIPETLMESEFFGYRKGAFTGAEQDRDGFFQAAHGGTLFLDELTELPLAMQVKLLRAIQERRVRKVGGVGEEPVDVRLISAAQQPLAVAVEAGRFRHDLYYRLNVIELAIPPLRDRLEDIPVLVEHILDRLAAETGRLWPRPDADVMQALTGYDYPSNVRELQNILERAWALAEGDALTPADLRLSEPGRAAAESGGDGGNLEACLDRVEREAILKALAQAGGNKTEAARQLGITFRSLRYRIDRLKLE